MNGMHIPEENLPPGFAEAIASAPAVPAAPRPAATVVLLRDAAHGPEALLLKRHRSAGFVPGAYVFPGGRVDPADADVALLTHVDRLPREPEPAYWMAAIREAFEETGILLAGTNGGACMFVSHDDGLVEMRARMMDDDASLIDLLQATGAQIAMERIVYCAHWITPVAEPRRYDTRFFLAQVPPECAAVIDEREMSDMVWLRPDDALERFHARTLPMVFPTVHTLEELRAFENVEAALDHYRERPVLPIQPRLVRRGGGFAIEVDEREEHK